MKLSAAGAATASAAALMLNYGRLFNGTNLTENDWVTVPQDAKEVFSKCGACSNTFFTLLNREFGFPKNNEELASDPLAGGLMNSQNQCGMLWGSTLAVGAESFRRFKDQDQALSMAMIGTRHVVESFSNRTKGVNCRDIIGFDMTNTFDTVEFALKSLPGGFNNMICMKLAEKWAPEAIQSAKEGLSERQIDLPEQPVSCAAEVAKKMGAGDEEMVTVAGLAGGIGLSGNGCGALGAAIWMKTLAMIKETEQRPPMFNPEAQNILNAFYEVTGSEILCSKLSGQDFTTISDHTVFINNGGCDKLIDVLARS